MNKIITVCLSLLLSFSLFGCSSSVEGIAEDFKITTDQTSEIFTEKEQMNFIETFKQGFVKEGLQVTLMSISYAGDEQQKMNIDYYKDIHQIDPAKKDVILLNVVFKTGHNNTIEALNPDTEYAWIYLVQMNEDGTLTILENGY